MADLRHRWCVPLVPLVVALFAMCAVTARAAPVKDLSMEFTRAQWEQAQTTIARSAETMRGNLSHPAVRRQLLGCADNDTTTVAVTGYPCAVVIGTYPEYCAGYFCPTCAYATLCDDTCDFCTDDGLAPSAVPTPPPTTVPSLSPVPTTTGITTYSQLTGAISRGEAVVLPAGVIEFDSELALSYFQVATISSSEGAVLSGGGHTRLFAVGPWATLTLIGLTLVNATVSLTACAPPYYSCSGAAIYNLGGTVTLVGCTIQDAVGWVRHLPTSRPRQPPPSSLPSFESIGPLRPRRSLPIPDTPPFT